MLRRFLTLRRERRERVQREATNLISFIGEPAYSEARTRARDCRSKGDRTEAKFWSAVAVEIAHRTGHQIGEKVADRYENPPPRSPTDREMISGLVDIAAGIADLARGRNDAMTLHNLKARVLQLADLRRSDRTSDAAADLCRAAEALADASEENKAALVAGAYPPKAEKAGAALQRLRAVLNGEPG